MADLLRRMWHAVLNRSPVENYRALRTKLKRYRPEKLNEEANVAVPNIQKEPVLADLATSRLPESCHTAGLLGSASDTSPYRFALERRGVRAIEIEWEWQLEWGSISNMTEEVDVLIVCKVPLNSQHWQALKRLKEKASPKVMAIQELLLPSHRFKWRNHCCRTIRRHRHSRQSLRTILVASTSDLSTS